MSETDAGAPAPGGLLALDMRLVDDPIHGLTLQAVLEGLTSAQAAAVLLLGDEPAIRAHLPSGAAPRMTHHDQPVTGLVEQLFFPEVAQVGAYHFPHYYVPWRLERPCFVSFLDSAGILDEEVWNSQAVYYYEWSLARHAGANARRIFVPTESAVATLARQMKWPEERFAVVPPALTARFQAPSRETATAARARHGLASPYLIAIGDNAAHRNFTRLVDTFSHWIGQNPRDLDLVVYGMPYAQSVTLELHAAEQEGGERVRFIEPGALDELAALLAGATGLVVPSLYEDYSLPLFMAQRAGVPVACSSAAPLRELAGDGALFFDPASAAEMAHAFARLAEGPAAFAGQVAAGRANESRFTPAESARRLIQACLGAL